MILCNIDPSQGLCDGTCVIITNVTNHLPEVRPVGDGYVGTIAFIPRSTTGMSSEELSFKLSRHRVLLSLAFAMTINKSQGQSVNNVAWT